MFKRYSRFYGSRNEKEERTIKDKITKLNVELFCPGCGYIVPLHDKTHGKADFDCRRCGKYKTSQFETVRRIKGNE